MEAVKDDNLELTVSIMGEVGVGKTEVIRRFLKRTKSEYQPTIFDRTTILYRFKPYLIEFSLQDIGGASNKDIPTEEFWSQWIQDSNCFILVYDVSKKSSLDYIMRVISEIKRVKRFSQSMIPTVTPFVPILVVGLVYQNSKRVLDASEVKKMLMKHLNLLENKDVPWMIEFLIGEDTPTDEIFQTMLKQAVKNLEKLDQVSSMYKKPMTLERRGTLGDLFTCGSESTEEERSPVFRIPK